MKFGRSSKRRWSQRQTCTPTNTVRITTLALKVFKHAFVKHAEYYVDGAAHTNGIENFWALLKRSIKGTYVSVEPFHMFRYLDEQSFRFNERFGDDADRFMSAMTGITQKRLTYKTLTGKQEEASQKGFNG